MRGTSSSSAATQATAATRPSARPSTNAAKKIGHAGTERPRVRLRGSRTKRESTSNTENQGARDGKPEDPETRDHATVQTVHTMDYDPTSRIYPEF